jgi:hypothetical protein
MRPMPTKAEINALAGSAIAAFHLAQFSFGALVKNGIVPKSEAEQNSAAGSESQQDGRPRQSNCCRNAGYRFAKALKLSAATSPVGWLK